MPRFKTKKEKEDFIRKYSRRLILAGAPTTEIVDEDGEKKTVLSEAFIQKMVNDTAREKSTEKWHEFLKRFEGSEKEAKLMVGRTDEQADEDSGYFARAVGGLIKLDDSEESRKWNLTIAALRGTREGQVKLLKHAAMVLLNTDLNKIFKCISEKTEPDIHDLELVNLSFLIDNVKSAFEKLKENDIPANEKAVILKALEGRKAVVEEAQSLKNLLYMKGGFLYTVLPDPEGMSYDQALAMNEFGMMTGDLIEHEPQAYLNVKQDAAAKFRQLIGNIKKSENLGKIDLLGAEGGFYIIKNMDNTEIDNLDKVSEMLDDNQIQNPDKVLKIERVDEASEKILKDFINSERQNMPSVTEKALSDSQIQFEKRSVESLRKNLRDHTRTRHSNTPYKNVEAALDDYLALNNKLGWRERSIILRQIGNLADIYLKVGTHAPARRAAVESVRGQVRKIADNLEHDFGNIQAANVNGVQNAEDRGAMLRILRRSMRNMPFNADAFSLWKAAGTNSDRQGHFNEIRNSEIVNIMAAGLQGQTFSDEKELNRLYDLAKKGLEAAQRYTGLNDIKFTAKYNEIQAKGNSKYKSGNASFDNALNTAMMKVLNHEVIERGMDIVPGEKGVTGPDHDQYSYGKRIRMTDSLADAKLKENSDLYLKMEAASQRSKQALFDTIFGISYEAFEKMLPINDFKSNRYIAFTVVVCLLRDHKFSNDRKLSLEQILDPNAALEDKKAFGTALMQELQQAAGGYNAKKQALGNRMMRSLSEHADELLAFIAEQEKHVGLENVDGSIKYAEAGMMLEDGLFDGFCQKTIFSDTFSDEKRSASCDIFRRPGEDDAAVQKRIEKLYAEVNVAHIRSGASRTLMEKECDLYNSLCGENTNIDSVNKNLGDIFCNKILIPASLSLQKNANLAEKELIGRIPANISTLWKSIQENLLKNLPMQGLMALTMDPDLKDRLKIEFSQNFIRNLQGKNAEERENNMVEDLIFNFREFGHIVLTDKDNNVLTVSPEMLKPDGHLTNQEKAFMAKFNAEIMDHCIEKEKNSVLSYRDEMERIADQIPAAFTNGNAILQAASDSMLTIRKRIEEFCRLTDVKGTAPGKNPYSNIIIGGRNASETMMSLFKKLEMNYKATSTEVKNTILSLVCASALNAGVKVTMVGPSNDNKITSADNKPVISELTLPADMKNSKEVSGLLKVNWNHIKGLFRDRTAENHQKKVDSVTAKVTAAMNKKYMDMHASLKKICPLDPEKVAENRKAAAEWIDTELNTALHQNKNTVKDFEFADKTKLTKETAFIAIAYAKKASDSGVKENEHFVYSGDPSGNVKDIMKRAAKELYRIFNKKKTDPAGAERDMRDYMIRGLRAMCALNSEDKIPDMDDYVVKHAADLHAQNELFRAVMFSKTPLGIGNNRREKARTMKDMMNGDFLFDHNRVALNYEYTAEILGNIYKGRNISSNSEDFQRAVAVHKHIMAKMGKNPKPIPFINLKAEFEASETVAKNAQIEKVSTGKDCCDKLKNMLQNVSAQLAGIKASVAEKNREAAPRVNARNAAM